MKKTVLIILAVLFLFSLTFYFLGVYSTQSFINAQIEQLATASREYPAEKFSFSEIDILPHPVQKYFHFALKEGITKPRFVRIKQTGLFKPNLETDFKPLTAEHYAITTIPGFIWSGDISFAKVIWVKGIDTYFNDTGSLLIKFMSGVTISKEAGSEIAQAQLVRWLFECFWYPTALLPSDRLKWSPVDSTSARLNFIHNDIEIEAVVHFNEDGSVYKLTSQRYMTTTAGPKLTGYTGYFSNYENVNGIMIPLHSEVEWNLDTGDFLYGKFDMEKIDFDILNTFDE